MALLNQTQQQYYDGDDFGGYQFISLKDIINNFIISYVGDQKIIGKIKRTDVAFHAQRAIQELSFDTFKSIKSQEINLPPSLTMVLPQDYVNYTKICWVDGAGIERPLYSTRHTSNPPPIYQNTNSEYKLTAVAAITNNTNNVTISGRNTDIIQGMVVTGNGIGAGAIVEQVNNDSANTFISLIDVDGTNVNSTYTGDSTLTFENSDGSLVLERETSFYVEDFTYSTGDSFVTASSASDIANVEIGMIVSGGRISSGAVISNNTVVTDIQGAVIFVSQDILGPSVTATNTLTFAKIPAESTTWNSYSTDSETDTDEIGAYDYDEDIYNFNIGQRYGLDPLHAHVNGSFYIDELKGKIHFSSNVSGKNIILKYISDGLGTDEEMRVHKFAEESMYKWILCAVMSTRTGVPEYAIQRYKKDKFAAVRLAKLRLSNLKIEDITRIMRGKSKWIKH